MPTQFTVFHKIKLIFCKEIKTEFRTLHAVSSLIMFALTTLSAVSMSIGSQQLDARQLAILFWIIFFFSAMAGLSRVFTDEQATGTIYTLRSYSSSQPVLWGKFLYNLVLLHCLALFLLPLFIIFLNVSLYHIDYFCLIVFAGNTGMAAAATLTASLINYTKNQASLFTILSFPIILPLFLTSIQLTEGVLTNQAFCLQHQLSLVFGYDAFLIGIASILFDYIWYD
jgi:heme exporter protein B